MKRRPIIMAGMLGAVLLTASGIFLHHAYTSATRVTCGDKIKKPGHYILSGDCVVASNMALHVKSDDVTIDLAGKTLSCLNAGNENDATFGIYAPYLHNVTIRNGSITGCTFGIHAIETHGLTVDGVDFSKNAYVGISLNESLNSHIRNSLFADIGGYDFEAYAIGINKPGKNCVIENNVFRNLYRQKNARADMPGEGVAILHGTEQVGCIDRFNVIENTIPTSDSIGIWIGTSGAANVHNNTIHNFHRGVVGGALAENYIHDNTISIDTILKDAAGTCARQGIVDNNTISGYPEKNSPECLKSLRQ